MGRTVIYKYTRTVFLRRSHRNCIIGVVQIGAKAAERAAALGEQSSESLSELAPDAVAPAPPPAPPPIAVPINHGGYKYKLTGIVVHSGQANGGHYYSYIMQRLPSGAEKWYKFDDNEVSDCRMEDDDVCESDRSRMSGLLALQCRNFGFRK